jgi:hypothetical protein
MQIILVQEDSTKKHVKDDDVHTPRQANEMDSTCADANVMVLPQYNKPKKTNNIKIMPQGESTTIGI